MTFSAVSIKTMSDNSAWNLDTEKANSVGQKDFYLHQDKTLEPANSFVNFYLMKKDKKKYYSRSKYYYTDVARS